MDIYKQKTYREVLKLWLKEQPNSGRGVARKMAVSLNISTVLISQILNGVRVLQMDYAFQLAKFMGLTTAETEYFLLMVQHDHAGTDAYQKYLQKRIELLQDSHTEIKNRVSQDIHLSEKDKAQFYSHWHYSAVRLLTDVPGLEMPSAIANYLEIPISRVTEVLEFLVRSRMCMLENGKFKMAVRNTHLGSDSPWIYSRQLQWRQKAIQAMESSPKAAVFYTGPMVLSKSDVQWVRDHLVTAIGKITDRAKQSPSEEMMCLNIDWFGVGAGNKG